MESNINDNCEFITVKRRQLYPEEQEYLNRRRLGEYQYIIRAEFGWSKNKATLLEKRLKANHLLKTKNQIENLNK